MKALRIGLLLVLALLAFGSCTSTGGTTGAGATTIPEDQLNRLVVWKVGGPWGEGFIPSASIQPQVAAELRKLGSKVECRSFPAKGFSDVFFDALDRQEEPDILVIDNYMILNGGRADVGTITGITSRPGVSDSLVFVSESLADLNWTTGWEILINTSKNHAAAKEYALRDPGTKLTVYGSIKDSPSTAVSELQDVAVAATTAYVAGNEGNLLDLSDAGRIGGVFSKEGTQVLGAGIAIITGNDTLAFAQGKCTFEQARRLGVITVLTTMRKGDDGWKVLSVSSDPISLRQLEPARSVAIKLSRNRPSSTLTPAEILTMEDEYPKPASGERYGNFEWKSSSCPDLVCEVVEFDYLTGTRLVFQFPKPGATSTFSTGQLWGAPGRWTWRVWSIDKLGNVVFSNANHFTQK